MRQWLLQPPPYSSSSSSCYGLFAASLQHVAVPFPSRNSPYAYILFSNLASGGVRSVLSAPVAELQTWSCTFVHDVTLFVTPWLCRSCSATATTHSASTLVFLAAIAVII